MNTRQLLLACALGLLVSGCDRPPVASATPVRDAAAELANVRSFLTHVQEYFNSGKLDVFMDDFADDAMQISSNNPDTVGKGAIRAVYDAALASNDIKVNFNTQEIEVAGDLAYERGTYTLHISSKADGKVLADIENRHMHIMRRQPDGTWKTWRMMTNSAAPAGP
jgi:ketosteroid isomerase-like protein